MLARYQVDPKKSTNQLAPTSYLIVRTLIVLASPSKCLQCLTGLNQPPLLGFVVRPSIDILDCDCVFVQVFPPATVLRCHRRTRAVRVVSHHLDGLSRKRLARILHLAADHGVRCVACACQAGHLPRQSRRKHRNSHNAFRTLRRIPLADSRTASPQPLPSCRSLRASTIPK